MSRMEFESHATPEEVMRAVEVLQEFAAAQGVPEKAIFGLALALEESGSNIVNHALKRDGRRKFQVVVERTGDRFVIELHDDGPGFDPTAVPAREPQAKDDDDLPGGWGLELVRRNMDEISYKREGGKNVLRLTKRLASATRDESSPGPDHRNQRTINMPLEIQIQKSLGGQDTGAVTVKLTGSLDTATAPELEKQLAPVLNSQIKDIVFDLAQLKFISSAGLRVFSSTRKTLKQRGGQASFIHMQPQIQEVFEIMKSLPGVAVFKDVAELDGYLAARQRSHLNA
jgi:anti-sigma B factor antagonist